MSSANTPARMTADEFLPWTMKRTEGRRHELVDGEVIDTAPEHAADAQARYHAREPLRRGMRPAKVPCEAFPDGMPVRVHTRAVFAPVALLRCGTLLDGHPVGLSNPLIVSEVVSESSRIRASGRKLSGDVRVPSVRHYPIVTHRNPTVIDHELNACSEITRQIFPEGSIQLDLPRVDVTELF